MSSAIINVIKYLNDNGVLNMISIIASPIITIIVLFFTLRHERKQFRNQMEQQQNEHRETVELMTKQHERDLAKQTEINNISIMPYLIIDRSIETKIERGHIYFKIYFTNKGNGTATELMGKYLDDLPCSYLCPLYKSEKAVYGCALPFDFEVNVVNSNERCCFQVYQMLKETNGNNITNDMVYFRVLFKDMSLNQYEQEFMFSFSSSNGQTEIQRVAMYPPKIIAVL